MSFSIQREVSNGTLSTIDLAIVYIDREDINVYVDDILIEPTGGSTPYTWQWITDSQVKITPNVPNGIVAMIKRTTPLDKMYHDYTAGAVFKDQTMDENFTQLLYLSQEAIEGSGATDFYTDIDMHGYRITNLAAAIDGNDAIPFAQYQSDALGALASRQGAEAARNAAAASQAAALASQNAAAISEANADISEANALASANTATTQAGITTTKASEASASAASAAASFDSFDDRYLGPKASDPTLDNDGNALISGALYWNSVSNTMRVWNGSIWQPTFISTSGDVVGPASAADNQLALFNGVTGKLIKAGVLANTLAALASPAFTGTPTAPTAAKGINTTQLATTAYVQAQSDQLSKSVAGGANVTLTATEAGNYHIVLTGAITANINVIVPIAIKKEYLFTNSTTGAFTVTVKTPAGTGVVVPQGKREHVYCDGVNILVGVSTFVRDEATLVANAFSLTSTTFGYYLFNSTTTNTPVAGSWFRAFASGGVMYAHQLWHPANRVWFSTLGLDGVTWSPWTEIALSSPITVTNLNNIDYDGYFYCTDAATGSPGTSFLGWFVEQRVYGAAWRNQEAISVGNSVSRLTRSSVDSGATWTPWVSVIAIGVGQAVSDVSGSRVSGTVYTNSTSRAIAVNFRLVSSATSTITYTIAGVTIPSVGAIGGESSVSFIVPAGATYSITWNNAITRIWSELR